ncbi:MAG TPA: VIT domain-containing protein, partial [Candidatus Solibacter sp.]|nr:VIT domain-containing protein [Candidatus Solibacter sp.]
MLDHSRWFAAAAGFSGAVALFYTLLFARILPFCLIGVIFILPLLGLAPVTALWTSIQLSLAWKGFTGWRPVVWGAAGGTVALVVLAAPAIGLRAGAQMAGSDQGWIRDAGYGILRTDAVSQEMLQSCEWNDGTDARNAIALLTGRGALTVDESRSLYYRATGQAYDQQPVSRWKRRAFLQFDEQRGGDRVGRMSADVQLTASQLDGRIDPRGATAYTEWTMTFHNSAATQQEARTEIALPHSSVVSRVTLWVNGEEREAAYGGSGQVRQAYESVVRA